LLNPSFQVAFWLSWVAHGQRLVKKAVDQGDLWLKAALE